jgi:hypothetical protein
MADFSFSIDVPITDRWENVELLRTSVQACFTAMFRDVDGCNAIAMVTGELLENAIKYGAWAPDAGGAFRLRVEGDDHHAVVSVENPIAADDANLASLLGTVRWLATFTDAGEAYRAKLLEIAAAPADRPSGGLGLVRVAYEGGCRLRADLDGGAVRVAAELVY